jgi:hypothetical protein
LLSGRRRRRAFVLLVGALAGCASIGPASVPRDRVGYADALSESWKDQMLMNIVRLRYADTPTFMDVASVISAYQLQGGVQAAGALNIGTPADSVNTPNATASVSALGGYADRPTVSYTPLTGRKFAQSLLEAIPPNAIFSLIAAGYPADVVLPVTIRAMNGVYNRTSQGGGRRASDPDFYPLIEAIRRIQISRAFSMRAETRGDEQVTVAVFAEQVDPEVRRDLAFVQRVLKLRPEGGEVILKYGALQAAPNELAILSRSMIEIMNEISADIQVPAGHVADGRTYANAELGESAPAFDLPHVAVHASASRPDDAFAATFYRGSWYWVSDRDFRSKRALTFLLLFFSLAETGATPEAPVLTIPVQ